MKYARWKTNEEIRIIPFYLAIIIFCYIGLTEAIFSQQIEKADIDELIITECVMLKKDNIDDYYSINPTIRKLYYENFLKETLDPISGNSLNSHKQISYDEENIMAKGIFKRYIDGIFETNSKLVHSVNDIELQWSDLDKKNDVQLKKLFKSVDKMSSNLLVNLLPLKLADVSSSQKVEDDKEKSYLQHAQKGEYDLLVRRLVQRTALFEDRLCRFFFPKDFSVSVNELCERPYISTDLKEIRLLAKTLAKHCSTR